MEYIFTLDNELWRYVIKKSCACMYVCVRVCVCSSHSTFLTLISTLWRSALGLSSHWLYLQPLSGFTATWRHIHSQQSVGFDGALHACMCHCAHDRHVWDSGNFVKCISELLIYKWLNISDLNCTGLCHCMHPVFQKARLHKILEL